MAKKAKVTEKLFYCESCGDVEIERPGGNWKEEPVCTDCGGELEEQVYTCDGCGNVVPWSNGCADDMPDHCDDCWAGAHEKDDEETIPLYVIQDVSGKFLESSRTGGIVPLRDAAIFKSMESTQKGIKTIQRNYPGKYPELKIRPLKCTVM